MFKHLNCIIQRWPALEKAALFIFILNFGWITASAVKFNFWIHEKLHMMAVLPCHNSMCVNISGWNHENLKLCIHWTATSHFPDPPAPVPGNHRSTFCLSEFDYFQELHASGIRHYLFLCNWLISRSIIIMVLHGSTRFMYVEPCIRIFFLFEDE